MATCIGSPSNSACSQWDADQTNCQNYSSHGGDCTWDAGSSTYGVCGPQGSQSNCEDNHPNCTWDGGGNCTAINDCSGSFTQIDCETIIGGGGICKWNTGDSTCYDFLDIIPTSCTGTMNCPDQTAQGQTACTDIGCTWDLGLAKAKRRFWIIE